MLLIFSWNFLLNTSLILSLLIKFPGVGFYNNIIYGLSHTRDLLKIPNSNGHGGGGVRWISNLLHAIQLSKTHTLSVIVCDLFICWHYLCSYSQNVIIVKMTNQNLVAPLFRSSNYVNKKGENVVLEKRCPRNKCTAVLVHKANMLECTFCAFSVDVLHQTSLWLVFF